MGRILSFYVCFLLVIVGTGYAQEMEDAAVPTQSEVEPVIPTDLICSSCSCGNETVDCTGRALGSFFTLADWAGLQDLQPKTVDLSNNLFTTVTEISALPIQHLNISRCKIQKVVNMAFKNLNELTTLDLSYNTLTTSSLCRMTFDRGFPGLNTGRKPLSFESMRTLSLAYNDIHSLPQDLFLSMRSLTTLDLSGNPMSYIDTITLAAIVDLTLLEDLRLSACGLEYLPEGMFRRQRRLQRLDLSSNGFTTIPAVLSEATNLVYLNLDRTPIVNITEKTAISSLTKLKELRLCRLSKLTSISASGLGGLESLEALYLCYNPRLTELDPAFLMWLDDDEERYPLLQKLHIQNNNISEIDSHFLDRWDQLVDVDATGNSYDCDCGAQWMVDVLVPLIRATSNNESVNNMYCKKPKEVRGVSLGALAEMGKQLTCPESESILENTSPEVAIIVGIMIGIFATFPLVLIIVLLWRRGYFAKCRKKVINKKYYDDDEEEETDAF